MPHNWSPHDWLVFLGFALAAIVGAFLKDVVARALAAFGSWVQHRFTGRKTRHRRALRKYRTRIHRDESTFRPPFNRTIELSMRDVFVPLRLSHQDSGPAAASGEAYATIRQVRRAVVIGPPGAGKSMLLRHSLLLWATGQPGHEGFGPPRVPVLVNLHRANSQDGSLRDLVVEALAGTDFPDAGAFVDRALADNRLELLLDGLDEVSPERRDQLVERIETFVGVHRECRIVVTCRSAIYRGQLADRFPDVFHIAEFDDRLIRRFLLAWPELPDRAAVDTLMAVLHDAPRIRALAGNPLLLTMIAYLFGRGYGGQNQAQVLPHNRSEFYQQVVDTMLDELRLRQIRYRRGAKRRILTRLALAAMDTPAEGDRRELPRAVVSATVEGMWPDLDLPTDAKVWDVVDELVDLSGLLLRIDGGERFGFAHLTLQEYLAAVELHADPAGLMDRWRRHPTTWREVVKLWCGSVPGDPTGVLRQVHTLDPVLALECLADTRTVEAAFAAGLIDEHRSMITAPAAQAPAHGADGTAVINAFGLVAADRRARGLEVFQFLVRALDDGPPAAERAARALARTNTTAAAAALGQAFSSVPFAREALVGMGDLAVPALEAIVGGSLPVETRLDALAHLGAIGTPTAATALVPFLWHGSHEDVQYAAAWQLASLARSPDIEDELASRVTTGAASGAPDLDRAPSLDWVWRPFTARPAPIVSIMGRVAWLVSVSEPPAAAPWDPGTIDPRIGMPAALRRAPSPEYAVLAWTGEPPAAVQEIARNQHRIFEPQTATQLTHRQASQLLAARLQSRQPLDGTAATGTAEFLDLIIPQAGFLSTAEAAVRRLDLMSRLVVVMLGLELVAITDRLWRGIFWPRRDTEAKAYRATIIAIHVGMAVLGLVATALSAAGIAAWGPSWLRLPLALGVGFLLLQVVTVAVALDAGNDFFSVASMISVLLGALSCWVLGLVAVIAWLGVPGIVLFCAAILGTAALSLVWVIRAPTNPVRDAITQSRLALGNETSVIS